MAEAPYLQSIEEKLCYGQVIHFIVQKVMETMESTFIVFFEKQTKLASSLALHGVGTAHKGENCAHECSYNIPRVYTYTTTYKEVYEVCNLNPINHGSNSILPPLFIYTFESPIEFFPYSSSLYGKLHHLQTFMGNLFQVRV